ncbi:probable polygalacturonase isoform X1 [Arachis ipaensis]|uniref:probable polygalacturonase isoform X1 n=1 Tax=Arachis ipaensis TaxID=130454 RepID=UPI0007AF76EE|nr:probable polygalacturonase isoform X1 [Arachis ipaensis]XP_025647023.1 probable polygalacturonase isoform X1 [Arachis hypogaea]
MKGLVAVLLLVGLSTALKRNGEEYSLGPCEQKAWNNARPHSVSILEFGAVGDGKTLNTVAFQNAIFYLKSFTDKGGAQLYVPSGEWLTGSLNLISHLSSTFVLNLTLYMLTPFITVNCQEEVQAL